MNCTPKAKSCVSHGWLDSLAISMSVICAVHCLLTPVLIALLPIISTTFGYMKLSSLDGIFSGAYNFYRGVYGCRRHMTKVALLSITGLAFILFIAIYQYSFHAGNPDADCGICPSCSQLGFGNVFNVTTVLNSLGGLFLASSHFRNYKLCRRADCNHS